MVHEETSYKEKSSVVFVLFQRLNKSVHMDQAIINNLTGEPPTTGFYYSLQRQNQTCPPLIKVVKILHNLYFYFSIYNERSVKPELKQSRHRPSDCQLTLKPMFELLVSSFMYFWWDAALTHLEHKPVSLKCTFQQQKNKWKKYMNYIPWPLCWITSSVAWRKRANPGDPAHEPGLAKVMKMGNWLARLFSNDD